MAVQLSSPRAWLLLLAWLFAMAWLPWWLGMPVLLALAAALLLLRQRLLVRHQGLLRRGLSWGLPGVLFASLRGLHGSALGWIIVLLGALAGYTLLAGLDAWWNRGQVHAPLSASVDEWPVLASADRGPAVEIIELTSPQWKTLSDDSATDPRWHGGSCHFADGARIEGVGPVVGFSPDHHWFVAQFSGDGPGVVLWQRELRHLHRLPGWQLSGWYHNQPWLARREDEMPLALVSVLGHDDG